MGKPWYRRPLSIIVFGLLTLIVLIYFIPHTPETDTKGNSIKIRTTTRYHKDSSGNRACTKEFLDELTGFYDEAKALSKSNDLRELEKSDHLLTVVIFSIPERPLTIPEEELLKRARKLVFQVNDKRYDLMNSKKPKESKGKS